MMQSAKAPAKENLLGFDMPSHSFLFLSQNCYSQWLKSSSKLQTEQAHWINGMYRGVESPNPHWFNGPILVAAHRAKQRDLISCLLYSSYLWEQVGHITLPKLWESPTAQLMEWCMHGRGQQNIDLRDLSRGYFSPQFSCLADGIQRLGSMPNTLWSLPKDLSFLWSLFKISEEVEINYGISIWLNVNLLTSITSFSRVARLFCYNKLTLPCVNDLKNPRAAILHTFLWEYI